MTHDSNLAQDQISVVDQSTLHRYRTEIPNIIFHLGLKAHDLATYLVLKRSAGDKGSCTKSIRRLSEEAGMDEKTFRKCKENLIQINDTLKKPLIEVYKRKKDSGDADTDVVYIVDIWEENFSHFGGGGGKTAPRPPKNGTRVVPKTAGKEEPFKNNQKQQQEGAAAVVIFDCLKDINIPLADKAEICQMYNEAAVANAVAFATHPTTKINTTMQQCIKWACKNQPSIPKTVADQAEENKKYAKHLETIIPKVNHATFYALNMEAEISYVTGQGIPICVPYTENGFKDQLHNALRKFGFKIDNLT